MCLRSKGKAAFTNLIFYTKANSIHSTHNTKQLYMFSEKLIHLTVKIYWSFHMSCILLFHTSSGSVPMTPPYEMGPTVIPILPTRHPKNRKVSNLNNVTQLLSPVSLHTNTVLLQNACCQQFLIIAFLIHFTLHYIQYWLQAVFENSLLSILKLFTGML